MADKSTVVIDEIVTKIVNNTPSGSISIIGITGNIASGKSSMALQVQRECKKVFPQKTVQVISTDDFLQTNYELNLKKLYEKKGFPESYRTYIVRDFVSSICSGQTITIPYYDHNINDINPHTSVVINHPDILIIEGLIVLHPPISPILNGSIFLEANMVDNYKWFKKRCAQLHLKSIYGLDDDHFSKILNYNWEEINQVNYFENVLPFKLKATFQIKLDSNHQIKSLKAN